MKGDSSVCATNDCRHKRLPPGLRVSARLHRSLRGSAPRAQAHAPQLAALGRCSSKGTEVAQAEPKAWPCLGLHQHLQGGLFGKRSASGGSRGAVVKPRTLQGPSTGSYCGWVVCPRWA